MCFISAALILSHSDLLEQHMNDKMTMLIKALQISIVLR